MASACLTGKLQALEDGPAPGGAPQPTQLEQVRCLDSPNSCPNGRLLARKWDWPASRKRSSRMATGCGGGRGQRLASSRGGPRHTNAPARGAAPVARHAAASVVVSSKICAQHPISSSAWRFYGTNGSAILLLPPDTKNEQLSSCSTSTESGYCSSSVVVVDDDDSAVSRQEEESSRAGAPGVKKTQQGRGRAKTKADFVGEILGEGIFAGEGAHTSSFAQQLATEADRRADGPRADGLFARSETLILFDWDDTLLPSSWLAERKLTLDAQPTRAERAWLDAVALAASQVLTVAVQLGRVAVVTNAENGWVDLSAAKFMPAVLATLQTWHVSVISARSQFESTELQHPVQWKTRAFGELLGLAYGRRSKRKEGGASPTRRAGSSRNDHQPRSRRNVVSFGDSDSERLALIYCMQSLSDSSHNLYKSLKLCEHPTPRILQRELQLLQHLLLHIVQHCKSLDLRLCLKKGATTSAR